MQRFLDVKADLRADGKVKYYEEGLSPHDGVTVDQVRSQLHTKLLEEEIEEFIATLQRTGHAEKRTPKPMAKFFTLG